jgi:hypothetical protein
MSTVRARSRLGNTVKKAKSEGSDPASDPAVIDARRELADAELRDHITKTVLAAPPLTDVQRARLAALLGPARTVTAPAPKLVIERHHDHPHLVARPVRHATASSADHTATAGGSDG